MNGVVVGEVMDGHPDVQTVNQHLLEKLDSLILKADDPETIASLTESLAKYNASIRNNTIFEPKETEKERFDREQSAILEGVLK